MEITKRVSLTARLRPATVWQFWAKAKKAARFSEFGEGVLIFVPAHFQ